MKKLALLLALVVGCAAPAQHRLGAATRTDVVTSVNGSSGAVGVAPIVLASSAAALSAVPTAGTVAAGGKQNGQVALISAGVSTGLYVLRTSSLTADGVNVITVTDDGARRWIRDGWDQGLPRLVSAVSDVVSLNIAGNYSLNLPSSSKTFFPLNAVFNFESYDNTGDFTVSPVIGLYYVPDPGTWGGRISPDVTVSAVAMSTFRSNSPQLPPSGKIFSGASFNVTTLQNAIRYPSSNPAFCKVVTPTDRAATGRVRVIGLLLD